MERIILLNKNDKRGLTDLELVNEFYQFLQGNLPEGIELGKGGKIKLNEKKSFNIIWYLQEHFSILPDNIEQCSICFDLYDCERTGHYSETESKHYCGACDNLHGFKD